MFHGAKLCLREVEVTAGSEVAFGGHSDKDLL